MCSLVNESLANEHSVFLDFLVRSKPSSSHLLSKHQDANSETLQNETLLTDGDGVSIFYTLSTDRSSPDRPDGSV